MPEPMAGPVKDFMSAMGPTGFMEFEKLLEVVGGVLVMIPLLRNLGLLILGPIIVNIVAFHALIVKNLFSAEAIPAWVVAVLGLLVLLCEWRAFLFLVTRPRGTAGA